MLVLRAVAVIAFVPVAVALPVIVVSMPVAMPMLVVSMPLPVAVVVSAVVALT
jgi:hypothetical protein